MRPARAKNWMPALNSSRSTPVTFTVVLDYFARLRKACSSSSRVSDAGALISCSGGGRTLLRDPLGVLPDDNRQFVHHVLGLPDYAPHRHAGGGIPFFGH